MKSGLRLAWLTCRQLLPAGLLLLAPLPSAAETAQNSELVAGAETVLLESASLTAGASAAATIEPPEAGPMEGPSPEITLDVASDLASDTVLLEPDFLLEPSWLRSQDDSTDADAPAALRTEVSPDIQPDTQPDIQPDTQPDTQGGVDPTVVDMPQPEAATPEAADAPDANSELDAGSGIAIPDGEGDAGFDERLNEERLNEERSGPSEPATDGAGDIESVESVEPADGEIPDGETAEDGILAEDEIPDESGEASGNEPDGELTAAEMRRRQLLIEGDRLFLQGDYAAAEQLYRQAKDAFEEETVVNRSEPTSDPEQLSPGGQVYWREYLTGVEAGLETRIFIPLELLTEEYPEFVPGHVEYARQLNGADRTAESLSVLERAASLYPNSAELAVARVDAFVDAEEWLQAAIAARQFAFLNPDNPLSPEFATRAEDYQDRFRRQLRGRLTRNAIGNAITGALGFALTGNIFGPLSAIETTVLMIRGESAVGESIANRAARELDLIEDEVVVAYVNDMGRELATLAGRDEFEYEFYVVAEDELNAFALPGGKVFVNAGAITRTETGAEFAGLLAHELAHAILSHGFQLVTSGNLTANVLQYIPYGGLATNLAVLRYSRDMERQADALGTQILASSPYAADGMHALMQTLYEETEHRGRFDWLSTHPDVPERIENIETLIIRNGYNRFAFEGIERHLEIRARVEQLLQEAGKIDTEVQDEPDIEANTEIDTEAEDQPDIEANTEINTEAEDQPDIEANTEADGEIENPVLE